MALGPWTVPGQVVSVTDGDTVVCLLDLGWHITLRASIRVDGIDAPELTTAEGKAAAQYARTLLPVGTRVTVVSKKLLGSTEKYGRVLADLTFTPPTTPRQVDGDFALAMVAAGHAREWDGRGAR